MTLSFINKTCILPNVALESISRRCENECRSWDCHDDCISECGNCEEGDYDWNPNCFDCFHDCDDCDCADCFWDDCY